MLGTAPQLFLVEKLTSFAVASSKARLTTTVAIFSAFPIRVRAIQGAQCHSLEAGGSNRYREIEVCILLHASIIIVHSNEVIAPPSAVNVMVAEAILETCHVRILVEINFYRKIAISFWL